MLLTEPTRNASWYARQAPDRLDTDEEESVTYYEQYTQQRDRLDKLDLDTVRDRLEAVLLDFPLMRRSQNFETAGEIKARLHDLIEYIQEVAPC